MLFEVGDDELGGHQVVARRQHREARRRQVLAPEAHLMPHELAPKDLRMMPDSL